MARLGVTLLLLLAGCGGNSLVVVDVEALRTVDGIAVLRTIVTASGHVAAPVDVKRPDGAAFTIPPGQRFAVEIPRAFAGDVAVHVDAVDAAGTILVGGEGSTRVGAGSRADVVVTLGGGGTCTPKSCSQRGIGCGMTDDGCNMPLDCGPCQVAALHPPAAAAGATVLLEGRFGESATVHFAGADASATVLGPERASVVVPAAAGSGPLTVTTAGATTAAVSFRRTRVTLVPQSFRSAYPQVELARQTPRLLQSRQGHASLQLPAGLYVIGGVGQTAVERALVNADGTLGPFANEAASVLTTVRSHFPLINANGAVLAFGGRGTSSVLSSIDRAPVTAGGALGAFGDAGVHLTTNRRDAAAVVVGSRVYVIGGASSLDDSALLDSVEVSSLAADGTLGTFAAASSKLTVARANFAAEVIGDAVFVFGGRGAAGPLASIERAAIMPDGSLGPFGAVTANLATARAGVTSRVLGDSVWLVGGETQAGAVANIDVATLASGQITGVADAGRALTSARRNHSLELVVNELYAIGGDASGQSLEAATLAATPAIGAVADLNKTLAQTGPLAVLGNWVYVVGGTQPGTTTAETAVLRAPIDADGNVGSFSDAGVPLTVGRVGHALAVVGNGLYVLGGGVGADGTTVDRAPIGSDGTLGAFSRVNAVTMQVTRFNFPALVIGDALFVFGGGGGVDRPKSDRAAINPDGSIGTFAASGVIAVGRSGHAAALLGGAAWIYGGTDGSASPPPQEKAVVGTDGSSLQAWTSVAGTAPTAVQFGALLLGDELYALGGTAATKIWRAPLGGGAIGSFADTTAVVASDGRAYAARTAASALLLSNGATAPHLQAAALR